MLIKFGMRLHIVKFANRWQDLITEKDFPGLMTRVAAIAPLMLEPNKYLYVRARAVSGLELNGPNDNGDAFRWAELLRRYATFIGSPVNLDHDNDDIKKAIGWIIDAEPKHDKQYVDIIMAIDRKMANKKYPGLVGKTAEEQGLVEKGDVTDVSMGCYVEKSICSACGNVASTPLEYCSCIRNSKAGKVQASVEKLKDMLKEGVLKEAELQWVIPDEFQREAILEIQSVRLDYVTANAFEINEGTTFFEESVITTAGADKDAKMTEVLASKDETPWLDFVIVRKADSVDKKCLHCKDVCVQCLCKKENSSKQEDSMTIQKEGQEKKVETRGTQLETIKDKGDYGSAAAVDKETADTAKGKSVTTDKRGNQLMTAVDAGEYVLASKDGKIIARGKEAVLKALLADDEGQELGGKPPIVEKEETKKENEKTEETKAIVPEETKKKIEDKEETKEKESTAQKIVNAVAGAFGMKVVRLADLGNPMVMVDKGDYGRGSEKDKASKDQGDKGGTESRSDIGKQRDVEFSTYEGRQDMKKVSQEKTSGKAAEAVQFIVGEMQKGKSFDEAKRAADEKYKEKEQPASGAEVKKTETEASKRISERNAMLQKIGAGNVAEDALVDSSDTKKLSDEGTGEQKSELSKDLKTTAGEGKDTEALSDEMNKEQKTQLTQDLKETAGADELEDGNMKTKQSPETKKPVDQENKVQDTEVAQETKGATVPETKGGATASKTMTIADAVDKAKDIVKKMDDSAEKVEKKIEEKKESAALFAKAKMNKWSEAIVGEIADLETKIDTFDKLSNRIEDVIQDLSKTTAASKVTLATNLVSLAAEGLKVVTSVEEDMKKKEDEEKKQEEARKRASQIEAVQADNVKLRMENDRLKKTFSKEVKNKSVVNLANAMVDKGLIAQAELPKKIAELVRMSEEALIQLKAIVDGTQKVSHVVTGSNKKIEEALRGLNSMQNAIVQRASSGAGGGNGSDLDSGTMFE